MRASEGKLFDLSHCERCVWKIATGFEHRTPLSPESSGALLAIYLKARK